MKPSYGLLVCGGLLWPHFVLPGSQVPQSATSKVDVQGISTHYRALGLKDRKQGQPVVVFMSGFGAPLEVWTPVLHELAGEAPLLVYDRPGAGQSSYDGRPATPGRVSSHLRDLLRVLDIAPPYILAGHSWGGVLLLDYASRFPGEVLGSVYVDPANFLMSKENYRQILTELGLSGADQLAYMAREEADNGKMQTQLPPGLRAEIQEILRANETEPSDWVPAQPRIPTTILLAGRLDPRMRKPPGATPPEVDQDAYFKAERALTLRQFQERMAAVPGSSVRVVPEAGHSVHRDAPTVVAAEIRRVLSLARRR